MKKIIIMFVMMLMTLNLVSGMEYVLENNEKWKTQYIPYTTEEFLNVTDRIQPYAKNGTVYLITRSPIDNGVAKNGNINIWKPTITEVKTLIIKHGIDIIEHKKYDKTFYFIVDYGKITGKNKIKMLKQSVHSFIIHQYSSFNKGFFTRKGGSSSSTPDTPTIDYSLIYKYGDDGVEMIEDELVEVRRAYAWQDSYFSKMITGKIKIDEYAGYEEFPWVSTRLAIVNPENNLERYEIRLYPETEKEDSSIQVRYVDRTAVEGVGWLNGSIQPGVVTDNIKWMDCDITTDKWYTFNVIQNGNKKWKFMLFQKGAPTCIMMWEDDRIVSDEYGIGVQSAGKYIVSQYNEVFGY